MKLSVIVKDASEDFSNIALPDSFTFSDRVARSASISYNLSSSFSLILVASQNPPYLPSARFIWHDKGRSLQSTCHHQAAITCYENAVKIDENYKSALLGMSNSFYRLGPYQNALECFDKVQEIDPYVKNLWHSKGLCFYNLGKFEKAIKCYDKDIEIESRNPMRGTAKVMHLKNLEGIRISEMFSKSK